MLDRPGRVIHNAVLALGLLCAVLACGRAVADGTVVECRVLYETADGIYVDAGTSSPMAGGDTGSLYLDGKPVGRFEVVKVSSGSTFLRLLSERPGDPLDAKAVSLVFDRVSGKSPQTKEPSPTVRSRTGDDDPFVPLLAPPDLGEVASTEARNIFHGRITLLESFQYSTDEHDDSISHLRSSGALERIGATPWTLEWSGDVSYRALEGLSGFRDFEEVRLELYHLSFFRRFEERSMVRLGRFLPRELPSAGFLDGLQGEKALGEHVRIGGMLGLKPDRVTLAPSAKEPTVVPYVSFDRAFGPDVRWSGTAGLLFSLYEGTPDRLAFLWDQKADFGPVSLFSSSEVDVDIGAAEARSGVRLTRWDLIASYPIDPLLRLRAGVDKFELPDTEAERDTLVPVNVNVVEFFGDGYWRYWAGASHDLPLGLRLSEEVSYFQSDALDALRWNVSLTRFGLPYLPAGSVTLAVYNLEGIATEGYGARLSAHIPLMAGRLFLQPAVVFRFAEFETTGENFFDRVDEDLEVADVSVRGQWVVSRSWFVSGGLAYAHTDEADRIRVDVGVTFKW